MYIYKGNLFEKVLFHDSRITYFLAHICNDVEAWGAGFTKYLSQWDINVERQFRLNARRYMLGEVQYCITKYYNTYVANMFAQSGIGGDHDKVDYIALEACLMQVQGLAENYPNYQIVMPKIGSGLAGGDWDRIQKLINRSCSNVTVYYL